MSAFTDSELGRFRCAHTKLRRFVAVGQVAASNEAEDELVKRAQLALYALEAPAIYINQLTALLPVSEMVALELAYGDDPDAAGAA